MYISNGTNNVTAEQLDEEHMRGRRLRILQSMMSFWVVQHEYKMLTNLFPKFDDNPDLGCDKVDKKLEEKEDSDSFDVPRLQ